METFMKKQTDKTTSAEVTRNSIPPLDIIDLDCGADLYSDSARVAPTSSESETLQQDLPTDTENPDNSAKEKFLASLSKVNFHIVFLIAAVALVIGIVAKFSDWGVFISQDDIFSDGMGSYDNSYDMMLPVFDANGDPVYPDYSQDLDILLFGNAPFADDRDSEDNLANIIQRETGATVYNCSVSDSLLAGRFPYLSAADEPMDAYNFYWLCHLLQDNGVEPRYLKATENLGTNAPTEAMYIYETLESIDMNDIEVIGIMYDGSDYLFGSEMYDDENFTNVECFTGNLAAGIEMLKEVYPHIRIIVMSPSYAYGLDEEGNYVSSDIQTYGWHFLSTYVIKQAEACSALGVTFIDHLYGTITEDNADLYLTDHIHLNQEGRQRVAERFLEALYYYQDRN